MVQLTLPKNSKIKAGKVWPKPEGATRVREFRIRPIVDALAVIAD